MPFWGLKFDCHDCPVLRKQLADALNELTSVQDHLQNVKRERQVFSDSLKSLQADVRKSNEKLLQNTQLITELKDKVALYQEANQIMFEKCAQVNDLEGEVKTLREQVQDSGQPSLARPSEQYATESPYRIKSATDYEDTKRPTREDALRELSQHLQELPEYLKQNVFTSSSSVTISTRRKQEALSQNESVN